MLVATVRPSTRSRSNGMTPIAVSIRRLSASVCPPSAIAVPSNGCPAKGSSFTGVKIRTWWSPPCLGVRTKVLSERFISRAMRCICSPDRSSAPKKTATGLPVRGLLRERVDDDVLVHGSSRSRRISSWGMPAAARRRGRLASRAPGARVRPGRSTRVRLVRTARVCSFGQRGAPGRVPDRDAATGRGAGPALTGRAPVRRSWGRPGRPAVPGGGRLRRGRGPAPDRAVRTGRWPRSAAPPW